MTAPTWMEDAIGELRGTGLEEVEVFAKRGRSRRIELGPRGRISLASTEEGWAVRAGGRQSSLFAAGSGRPDPSGPWPAPDGQPLALPAAPPAIGWTAPAEFDTPLIGELEGVALLEGLERELARELPGTRLLHGRLEDGSSESELINSHAIHARFRQRTASIYFETSGPQLSDPTVRLQLAGRAARAFDLRALARRVADLRLVAGGKAPDRDRGDFVLAPEVGIDILRRLMPLWLGPQAAALASGLGDSKGRLGSDRVTVVDDGRLAGGVLAAPVDGEGTPTGETFLVEEGIYRQPLMSWRERSATGRRFVGCVRRAGWRDLPRIAPSHLFLKPDPAVTAMALIGSVARGYYLLASSGGGSIDLRGDRICLPVSGFSLRQGRAVSPVAGAWLCGAISTLLRNIEATARDLRFLPLAGMLGSPTLLVGGLELRDRPC